MQNWKKGAVFLGATLSLAGCGFQAHAAPNSPPASKTNSTTTKSGGSKSSGSTNKPGSKSSSKSKSKSKSHSKSTSSSSSSKSSSASSSKKPMIVTAFWASDSSVGLPSLYKYPHGVTDIAPFWYSMTASGVLHSKVVPSMLTALHAHHIGITPLVNDATGTQAFLKTRATRIRAAASIAAMVRTNHFQGVNIDFEPPHTRVKSVLAMFLRDLRDRMPKSKTITVDVVPHSGGAYNYKTMAPDVSQFILMSYDEHSSGSPAGPVSGWPWVKSILTRLKGKVPTSKIQLGVPLYGYEWPMGSMHAHTIPYNKVTSSMNSHAKWSPTFMENYAKFGGHVYWWESLQGMNDMIHLAKSKHMAGVALWHIGYANNAVMQMLLHQVGKQP